MNEHDTWRTWDKHRDCRGLMKVFMDGCEKDSMKTCRWMLHQMKTRQMTIWKEDKSSQVKRKLEMQQSSSSSLAVKQSCHRQTKNRKVSKQPAKYSKQESRALLLSMDVTRSTSQQQRFVNRPGQSEKKESRGEREELFTR